MTSWRACIAALLAPLALGACVVAPVGYDPYDTVAVADVPPPAPLYEVQPAVPFLGAVWISGYWGWYGARHQWVPGYWARAPHGQVWLAPSWHPYQGRWALRGGGWARGH